MSSHTLRSRRSRLFFSRTIAIPQSVWWFSWSLTLVATWLLPTFNSLWPSFDLEFLASICCIGLFIVLVLNRSEAWEISKAAMWVACIGSIPVVQYLSGNIYFFGDAWMCSLYLLGLALSIVVGYNVRDKKEIVAALFFAIGLAATLSVAIELKQWLRLEGLYFWTRDIPPGERPFANLGQPNNLATLLCCGLVATWWAQSSKKINGTVAIIVAAYLLFGLALTQSRTGWLMLLAILATAFVFRAGLINSKIWIVLLTLSTFFVICVLTLNQLGALADLANTLPLKERVTSGHRLAHWRSMVEAISIKPWFGWGWGQVSVAQQAVATRLPAVPELISYSHDLMLDLLVWSGIPIGVTIIIASALWLKRTVIRIERCPEVHIFAMLFVMLMHSMVEFPFTYFYFLFPAGLAIGLLDRAAFASRTVVFGKPVALALFAAASIAMTWTVSDYLTARTSLTARRYELARIGSSRNSEPPELILLTQLEALARMDRMAIHQHATEAELRLSMMTAERFPAERLLMQYAALAVGRNDLSSARLALVRLCKTYEAERCLYAQTVWNHWSTNQYPWLKGAPFPAAL